VRRTWIAVSLVLLGAVFVAAFYQSAADDPCRTEDSAATVAVFIAAALFGTAAYLVLSRFTSHVWILVAGAIATTVVSFYTVLMIGFLSLWVPSCGN
jgi:hypothetical protein